MKAADGCALPDVAVGINPAVAGTGDRILSLLGVRVDVFGAAGRHVELPGLCAKREWLAGCQDSQVSKSRGGASDGGMRPNQTNRVTRGSCNTTL